MLTSRTKIFGGNVGKNSYAMFYCETYQSNYPKFPIILDWPVVTAIQFIMLHHSYILGR